MPRIALLLSMMLVAPVLFAATDAELRVTNVVIDWHIEHARDFWENEVAPTSTTMAGIGRHTGRLVVLETTIAPRIRQGYVHEETQPDDDARLARVERTSLFRRYTRLRSGRSIESLHHRRDLLVVPGSGLPGFKQTIEDVDPELFYGRYPRARGLLLLTDAIVSEDGKQALMYGELLMIFSTTGRLFHLTKLSGRWIVDWSIELLSVPGC
jgi:hypothetical protein